MKMKRFLSILLTVCMMLSLLPANVLAVEWPVISARAQMPQRGADAPQLVDGYYEIYNADQLYWFAEKVNGGETAINGKLMADIVVNENVLNADGTLNGDGSNFRVWTPIGNSSQNFIGTFNGNGKTIFGLYFNDTSVSYVGLFGYLGYGGKVQNVGVVGTYFSGADYVGGVAGFNYIGTVINCYNAGSVSGDEKIGGVVGGNYKTVSNCYNTGNVSGYKSVGGVVGINRGPVSNCYNAGSVSDSSYFVGGVVGENYDGTVSDCYNSVSVSGIKDVGGVVGHNRNTVSNSYNTGSVSGDENIGGVVGYSVYGSVSDCYNTGGVSGADYVGGVVGYNKKTVSNCYNTGSVSGSSYDVGGVVGGNYETVSNSYNTGSVSGSNSVGGVVGYNGNTVSNSYNTGSVSGSNSVGGVVGYNRITVSNSYNTGSVSGDENIGGVVGYNTANVRNCYYLAVNECTSSAETAATAEQFSNGKVAYLLGDAFGQSIGTDVLPVLGGSAVYQVTTCGGAGTGYANDSNAEMGHSYLTTEREASCLEQGMTLYECQWCSNWYTENVIDALGHSDYVNGLCTRCGIYEPAVLKGDVYEISNAGQLYWFAEQVNTGSTAIHGKLMADIVVNENVLNADGTLNGDGSNFRAWTPIGNDSRNYSGTFDGNGKTISGLYFNDTSKSYVGLFGYMGSGGEVKNVGVVDIYIRADDYVGGVVGYNYDGTVSNSYNTGSVSGDYRVGGVVGFNDAYYVNASVSNCYNTGLVSGNNAFGGVVGDSSGTVSNCYNTGLVSGDKNVGGVVGRSSGTVSNSCNTGDVSGSSNVGGVVGDNNASYTIVIKCYNTGDVSGSERVGGVAGYNYYGTISDCYNTGSVSGSSYVGGVVGYNYSYRNGNDAIVTRCFNTGTISCSSYVGSVVGYNSPDSVVRYCYYLSGSYDYYSTAKTAAQFASGEVAYLLQGQQTEQIWGQKIRVDKYPVLFGEKVYQITDGKTILGYSNVEGQMPEPGVTVSGQLISYLEGDVTVELVQDGEVVYSTTATDGSYVFEGVVAGDYTLRVTKANHISQEYAITVGNEAVTQDATICPTGDVTGDGVVNIKDFQRLLRHVNKTNPLADYALACGDVTGDGVCNIKDFQRLLRHVNKTNPLF